MATFETTRPVPFGAVTIHRIITAIEKFSASVTAKSSKRATGIELNKLSDIELADIGLCRGDINSVTAPAARRF